MLNRKDAKHAKRFFLKGSKYTKPFGRLTSEVIDHSFDAVFDKRDVPVQ